MKKLLNYAICAIALFGCAKQNEMVNKLSPNLSKEVMTRKQINNVITTHLKQKNEFWWRDADVRTLWSAGQITDKIYSIGYKPSSMSAYDVYENIDKIDINSPEFKKAKNDLLSLVQNFEGEKDLSKIIAFGENTLPYINVYINKRETLEALRKLDVVRYVEPIGYDVITDEEFKMATQTTTESDKGCGGYNPINGTLLSGDFVNFGNNNKQSWNHSFHKVRDAWNRGIKGSGRKIMIIDTGISPDQNNFYDGIFNGGLSTGRTIQRIATLRTSSGALETPWDDCGHGTVMAGVAAAPAVSDGNAVGIAYGANLVTCNATNDVLINETREVNGVSDALIWGGNSDVNIISMSIGSPTSNSQIADAVKYATNRNKLVFCAGGTSTNFLWIAGWYGVIFPANMNEVIAVTGVKNTGALNNRCNVCHEGSQIDFTVVMEKQKNSTGIAEHPLTTAMYGDNPGEVGGSSVATASAAGMAALVWSVNPNWSAATVRSKLTATASNYPNPSSTKGWGNINVDAAAK